MAKMTPLPANFELTWNGPEECPRCHQTVVVGIMSLAATCECGMYFADVVKGGGWFESRSAYESGVNPIRERGWEYG